MAITKKETALLWELLTNAQHTAWIEGFAIGEDGGEKRRNPYPVQSTPESVMDLYRLLKGASNA